MSKNQSSGSNPTPAEATSPPRSGLSKGMPFVLIGLGVLYIAFFWLRGQSGVSGTEHPGVGSSLTDVSFSGLTAEESTTSDDWKGKVVLLNFWGTWCPPCRREFPHIVHLNSRFESNPEFKLVSVSCPSQVTVEELKDQTAAYLKKKNVTFGTHYDAIGRSMRRVVTAAKLPTAGIPITVVLDQEGTIRGVWQGFMDADAKQMESLVAELLGEALPADRVVESR